MSKKHKFLAARLGSTLLAIGLSALSFGAAAQQKSYGPYPEETYLECGQFKTTTAVVLVHGGWNLGGSNEGTYAYQLCDALGKRRVHVYSINYRLAKVGGFSFPAQLQDVQLALRWVRSLGIYTRVVLIGMSAGGYNAELATFMDSTETWAPTDPLGEAKLFPDISSRPDAVALLSPFSDLTDPKLSSYAVRAIVRNVTSKDANISPLMAQAIASPLAHIKTDIAPTLVIHGRRDTTVPITQSEELVRQLQYMGAPVRLQETGGQHILGGYTEAGLRYVLALIGDCAVGLSNSICAAQ
jgi:acetyl esterase/lipase